MSWTYDAPAGVYKDHSLSSKIRQAAVADSQFMRFMSPEPGYGKGRGASVTITRFHNLPLATQVSEQDRLPTGKPEVTTVQKAVAEWGYKVQMTEFESNLTHFDLKNRTQRALRDQMRLTLDKMAADALKTTPMKIVAGAADITLSTTGTPSGSALGNASIAKLGDVFDIMYGDYKVPPWKNGRYVCVCSPKFARGLKNDDDFATWWSRGGGIGQIQRGNDMLPDIQGFDIYVTNHYDALDNTIGSGDVTGEAVFFGEDAGFLAVVQEPELRAGPKEDLGRFSDVGWVGTIEAGLVWNTASDARVFHWSST